MAFGSHVNLDIEIREGEKTRRKPWGRKRRENACMQTLLHSSAFRPVRARDTAIDGYVAGGRAAGGGRSKEMFEGDGRVCSGEGGESRSGERA